LLTAAYFLLTDCLPTCLLRCLLYSGGKSYAILEEGIPVRKKLAPDTGFLCSFESYKKSDLLIRG